MLEMGKKKIKGGKCDKYFNKFMKTEVSYRSMRGTSPPPHLPPSVTPCDTSARDSLFDSLFASEDVKQRHS